MLRGWDFFGSMEFGPLYAQISGKKGKTVHTKFRREAYEDELSVIRSRGADEGQWS